MKSRDNGNSKMPQEWTKLSTIKSFDGVSSTFERKTDNSHRLWLLPKNTLSPLSIDEIDGKTDNKPEKILHSNASAPYSLLVQSLIKQLCFFLETDKDRSNHLYKKICGKLFEMKLIDETFDKSEFENIRLSYELALKQLVEVTRGNALPASEEIWPLSQENSRTALEWSRYFRDFDEIDLIGSGGFGEVWKAKHKLDHIEYAIKKICIKSTSVKTVLNHLKEVKTLASLNHINIVSYKSCWLEPLASYQKEEMIEHQSSSTEESSNYDSNVVSSKMDSLRLKSESFTIDFEYSKSQKLEIEKSESIAFESRSKIEKIRRLNENALIPHVKLSWAILYIQMKLCQKTLRNFLDERNELSDIESYYAKFSCFSVKHDDNIPSINSQFVAFSIFQQICRGLDYIHSMEIVHHDIKPSNVFISEEPDGSLLFQLGDFGLACPLEQENDMVRHDGFGTRLYAASEQLLGQCSKKSDIYSMGVILIELLSKCVTIMECFKKVENIKKGIPLSEIDESCCSMIKKLLNPHSEQRPDIATLKNLVRIKLESSDEISRLKKVISDKDFELEKKDLTIGELRNEILMLKKQLSIS